MADDIAKEAREAISTSFDYDKENRREAVEDLRFIAGFQWSDSALADRQDRPVITINRSQQFLRNVTNPIRQNMPVLKVETDGGDDGTDPELANGLLRRIQYNSSAAHVYANATEHAVGCGIGWFRVATDYYNDEGFDQDICIKRVFNPLTVYPDPGAVEPDRSDMSWCLVSEPMPTEAFKAKYKGKSTSGMDDPSSGQGSSAVAWGSGDWVRVAEYWKKTETADELLLLMTGDTVRKSGLSKEQYAMLKDGGFIQNSRPTKSYKVTMTLVSGVEQLEDPYEFPCKWIPLIPVIGAEVPLERGVYRHGLIRFQREPQQLNNYFLSVAAESLGQQPKAPWLVTHKMIAKFKGLWDNANRESTPYLVYEPDSTAPGGEPKRIAPPPLPAGLVQFAQMMQDDMKASTGIYDAALGQRSNETSGVAIAARKEQGTNATFHYVDNLEHSLDHLGRVLLNMMPKVYDTPRAMKLHTDDDREKDVVINQEIMQVGGVPMRNNDVTRMKFDSVRVVLGPSYASRKQETVQQLLQLVQALPQVGAVAGDLIAKNLDFDGSEQLAERLRLLLPPQVMQMEDAQKAGNEDGMAQPGPPEDPMAAMQAEAGQAMMKIELETANAKSEQEKAKAAQEGLKVEGVQLDNALKVQRLTEPPPQRSTQDQQDGNRPGNGPF